MQEPKEDGNRNGSRQTSQGGAERPPPNCRISVLNVLCKGNTDFQDRKSDFLKNGRTAFVTYLCTYKMNCLCVLIRHTLFVSACTSG